MSSKENCCKNCFYAEDYSGYDDHFCKILNHGIRAEVYDCDKFRESEVYGDDKQCGTDNL